MEVASRGALLVRCGGRSCAGLLLGWEDATVAPEGLFVLVPGIILGADLASVMHSFKDVVDGRELTERIPKIKVIMRRGQIKPRLTAISSGAVMVVEKTKTDDLAELGAALVAAWRWSELAAKLPHLLSEFKLSAESAGPTPGHSDDAGGELRDLLSVFLVLQLQPVPDDAPSLGDALRRALQRVPGVPPRGSPVCTACAPLAAPALLGAVCRGVVSGSLGLLTLTDARVSPGGEGAAVFAVHAEQPFAVVLSPLTWWRGEAVGFTLCLGLRRLLAAALRDLQRHHGALVGPSSTTTTSSSTALALAPKKSLDPMLGTHLDLYGIDKSVVMVRCGHMWGSGFVVDKRNRVVLTCAHVLVEEVGEPTAPTVCWGRSSVPAAVLWRSADGMPYDIAILQLADDPCVEELVPLALDTREPRVGEQVYAVGFPLFPDKPGRFLRPLVSRGEVSGWWPSASSQILTTCCVQSGASGGPLLRLNHGQGRDGVWLSVIGLLVCNAQLGTGQDAVVFPHVNFALWTNAVVEPINAYLNSGDKRHLGELQCKNDTVQRQWKLHPPILCKL